MFSVLTAILLRHTRVYDGVLMSTGGNSHQRAIERAEKERLNKDQTLRKRPETQQQLPKSISSPIKKSGRPGPKQKRSKLLEYAIIRMGVPFAVSTTGVFLVSTSLFPYGVFFFYLGLALFAIDLQYENSFRGLRPRIRTILVVLYLAIIAAVSHVWIFRPAPFEVTASSTIPQYGPNSVIDGIEWDPNYSDLHFSIKNLTGMDYDGFDAEISTDLIITEIRQLRGLSECKVESSNPSPEVHVQRIEGGQPVGPVDSAPEKYKVIPADRAGRPIFPKFYRIRCEKLPATSQLDFTGALGNVTGSPRAANWVSVTAKFQTSGRNRTETISQCSIGAACRSDGSRQD
jgi:hypothetical protein